MLSGMMFFGGSALRSVGAVLDIVNNFFDNRNIECPCQQLGRVTKKFVTIRSSQNNSDGIMALVTSTGNQTMLALVGVASLHPVAEKIVLHGVIGIL